MPRTRPKHQLYKLRLAPCRGLELADGSGLDEQSGLIHGFSVMEEGEIRGHDMEADALTLSEVVRLANAAVDSAGAVDRRVRGLKMRKGHPSMSFDALGSTMAAARDFRIAPDGRVRADGQFLEAANAEDRRHIFALAKERPDFFGTSMVVSGAAEKRLDDEGRPAKGEDGKALLPFFRPSAVHAVDFVDKGAATAAGFFAGTTAQLSAEVAEQLAGIAGQDDFGERVQHFFRQFETDHPGTAVKLRAALEGDAMADEPTPAKGEEPEKGTNDEAIAKLEAAGFQVKRPVPPKAEPPKDDLVLTELAAIKQQLADEKAARVAAEAKALESARETKLGEWKSRLDNLAHLGRDQRETALKLAGLYLKAGDAEDAEAIIAGAEKFQDPLADAMLAEQISVPLAEGEGSQTVDLSVFADYVETVDGGFRRELKGNRRQLARAALAEQIEDPEARRQARMASWVARRNEEMGGVR